MCRRLPAQGLNQLAAVRTELQRLGQGVGRIRFIAVGNQPLGDQRAVGGIVSVQTQFSAIKCFETDPRGQPAREIEITRRLQSAVACHAVPIEDRLNIAEEIQWLQAPGRRHRDGRLAHSGQQPGRRRRGNRLGFMAAHTAPKLTGLEADE